MAQAKPSKTALKREYLELQALGERLIGLDPHTLERLPIDSRLRDAVLAARTIRSRGALRRQKQLIGKYMRDADADSIRDALDDHSAAERQLKRVFSEAERWRDRIVDEGDAAVDAFAAASGELQTQLKQQLTELRSTSNERAARSRRRQIFRLVHDELLARARDDRISR